MQSCYVKQAAEPHVVVVMLGWIRRPCSDVALHDAAGDVLTTKRVRQRKRQAEFVLPAVCVKFRRCDEIRARPARIRTVGDFVVSFDGDRIMGVFIGSSTNTAAVKAALQTNYMFRRLLVPRFKQQYEVFNNGSLPLEHCSGIDMSDVLVVRAGVRKNNDLVWVGQAPNIAAKLSGIRDAPYYTFITEAVYDIMASDVKLSSNVNMWEAREWSVLPDGLRSVYRSSWTWTSS